jgi:hypothetical protein
MTELSVLQAMKKGKITFDSFVGPDWRHVFAWCDEGNRQGTQWKD